jgi:hypothetical protein
MARPEWLNCERGIVSPVRISNLVSRVVLVCIRYIREFRRACANAGAAFSFLMVQEWLIQISFIYFFPFASYFKQKLTDYNVRARQLCK